MSLGVGFVVVGVAAGCGDEVVCPSGTGGSPCRYTVGVGTPPSLLPPVIQPDVLDVTIVEDVDEVDLVPDSAGSGDVEVLDAAEINDTSEGPDTEPSEDADDGDIEDVEPNDARTDMAAEAKAPIDTRETPDVLRADAQRSKGDPAGSARLTVCIERPTEDTDRRQPGSAPGRSRSERTALRAHT